MILWKFKRKILVLNSVICSPNWEFVHISVAGHTVIEFGIFVAQQDLCLCSVFIGRFNI